MGRRSRRGPGARRLLAVAALTLAGATALPMGLAQMAANDVPVTRAGQTDLPVGLPSLLVATGPDDSGLLSAEVTSDGSALPGVAVDFALATSPGDPVCDDVLTDAGGRATCDPGLPVAPLGEPGTGDDVRWVVAFAGAGTLEAAADTLDTSLATVPDDATEEPVAPLAPTSPTSSADPGHSGPSKPPPARPGLTPPTDPSVSAPGVDTAPERATGATTGVAPDTTP